MIILIAIILFGLPALLWDYYAHYQFKGKDKSVSEFIYRFVHEFPILLFAVVILVTYFFHTITEIEILLIGLLVSHFSWKA